MAERPILRFPNPTSSARRTGSQRQQPRPTGPGRQRQGQRFQATFDRLSSAFDDINPAVALRQDPTGIAPERALVFVTAGSIADFARAARDAGLEIFTELELDELEEFPDGFEPARGAATLARTLYVTIPTVDSFRHLLALWNAHQRGEAAPNGAAPWWKVFDLLLELRPWGPEDRLTGDARAVIEDRLPFNDDDLAIIEFEIWPTASSLKRSIWRNELEQCVRAQGGTILDQSSISGDDFIYEAILAELPCHAVRAMLHNPAGAEGLATLEGLQFILPQTIGQTAPSGPESASGDHVVNGGFDSDAPTRAAVLDGTPAAAHAALDGGVIIEDLHDLVRLSQVDQRYHATAMASLILRGDLDADGEALSDTRLISVPLLIDNGSSASTPGNRLFVDLLHTTLMQLIGTNEALAPDVFVVNFSIGVLESHFAGRVSALARLIDWWASKEGILFVISAGNVGDVALPGVRAIDIEDTDFDTRRNIVRDAIRAQVFNRTLLSPSESLNGLTVGALSTDLIDEEPPAHAGLFFLEIDGERLPQVTSALGLGSRRSIKPDLLEVGGRMEVRAIPNPDGSTLQPIKNSNRTGLVVAAPSGGTNAIQKSRGTSPAAALVTRAILRSAEALTGEDGPYEGQELPRRQLSLLTRALAVNSAKWPEDAIHLLEEELQRLGRNQHPRAKEEVCRRFGYGLLAGEMMRQSPEAGVTLLGLGSVRKDHAQVFKLPVPPSMAGERVPRSMRVTLAWFSPVNPARAQYRLAALEAVAADGINGEEDKYWGFDLKVDGPDANIIKRGSVWSKRLINRIQVVPDFEENADIPICVQCRDASGGGLSPDDNIEFAIAVTLQVEADVQFDIHQEVEQQVRIRLGQGGI